MLPHQILFFLLWASLKSVGKDNAPYQFIFLFSLPQHSEKLKHTILSPSTQHEGVFLFVFFARGKKKMTQLWTFFFFFLPPRPL